MSQKIRNLDVYLNIKQYLEENKLMKNQHLINIRQISKKLKLNYLTAQKYIKDILNNFLKEDNEN